MRTLLCSNADDWRDEGVAGAVEGCAQDPGGSGKDLNQPIDLKLYLASSQFESVFD
jgi:hypothetical protein